MISAFLSSVWPYLLVAIGSILAFFGYGIKKKSEGKQEAENEQNEEVIKNIQKAREAENEADNINNVDDALRDNDWMRD